MAFIKEYKKNRILEIDIIRGVCVFLMILDHFMYDSWALLSNIFKDYPYKYQFSEWLYNFANNYWWSDLRLYVRYIVVFLFLALTGICCHFSKSNLKRGVKLFIVSLGLTLVTFIVGYVTNNIDLMITFGVLHAISLSLIIVSLLQKFIDNKWVYLGLAAIMLGVGIHFEINASYISYNSDNFFIILLKQIVGISYAGSDCFPLLSTCGIVFIGVFLGKLLYDKRESLFHFKYHNNIVTFTGRNSLLVYVAHQIIIPVILIIICLIAGFKINI